MLSPRQSDMDFVEDLAQKLRTSFGRLRPLVSLYIYGSILSKRFRPGASDVDVLMIAKDTVDPTRFIRAVKRRSQHFKGVKLDISIVFQSEFRRRWHIYRTPLFFIGIKNQCRLVYGAHLLRAVRESSINPEWIYKRAVDLAQSSRSIYLNGKDKTFWEKKYVKWLRVLALEALFLTGQFELHFPTGMKQLQRRFPDLAFLSALKKTTLPIATLNDIAERLATFVRHAFIEHWNHEDAARLARHT